jgi:hypothetical protein
VLSGQYHKLWGEPGAGKVLLERFPWSTMTIRTTAFTIRGQIPRHRGRRGAALLALPRIPALRRTGKAKGIGQAVSKRGRPKTTLLNRCRFVPLVLVCLFNQQLTGSSPEDLGHMRSIGSGFAGAKPCKIGLARFSRVCYNTCGNYAPPPISRSLPDQGSGGERRGGRKNEEEPNVRHFDEAAS